MRPRSRIQFTIGQWTALVGALALFLALPGQKTRVDFQIWGCVLAFVPVLLLVSVAVDALVGIPCPGCGRWTLRRLALASTCYCCSRCGGRFRRVGIGAWRDASGPEYAATFRGKTRARSWLGFAVPQADGDSTTAHLLRNRRRRERAGAGASATSQPLPQSNPDVPDQEV